MTAKNVEINSKEKNLVLEVSKCTNKKKCLIY